MAIYPQGARYVWNRTEMLAAAADPSVTYLMGNKRPTHQDVVVLLGCLQALRLCSLCPPTRSLRAHGHEVRNGAQCHPGSLSH